MGRLDRAVQELPAQEDAGGRCGLSIVRRRRGASKRVKKGVSYRRQKSRHFFFVGADIEGVRACKHPKGHSIKWLMHWVALSRVGETGPRRRGMDVLHRSKEAEGRPAAKQKQCEDSSRRPQVAVWARRFKFEIEVLTTEGVSESMFWNAKNDLSSSRI